MALLDEAADITTGTITTLMISFGVVNENQLSRIKAKRRIWTKPLLQKRNNHNNNLSMLNTELLTAHPASYKIFCPISSVSNSNIFGY